MVSDPYEYDIAVSFAGAQRAYVEQFVDSCRQRGLVVFYDRDMAVAYWGRNFIYEFRKVYGGSAARFVMPFISAEYLTTPYPRDEFAAAVEQGFRREGQTYLLPVVVGDVTIPPELLNPAVGMLRADDHTPSELAGMTVQRLAVAEPGAGPRPAPPPPPPAPPRSRWKAITLGALLVAVVAVVITASVLVPDRSPDSASSVTSTPTATRTSISPSCQRQPVNAVVKVGPDSGSTDISLLEASYQVADRPGGEIFIDLAGKVRGRTDRDQVLWILGTADHNTRDSTENSSRGSTQLHVVQQVKPNSSGCWTVTRHPVRYPCVGGLTFRYYLAVLSPQQAQEMQRLDQPQDGFTQQDIQEDRRIPLLSTFDVPTERNC